MFLVLRIIFEKSKAWIDENSDPRNENWFLMGSPFPVLLIIGSYLYFIKAIGPKYMEDRKPFDLKSVINVYNILQILINLYVGLVGLYYSYLQPDYNWKCQPVEHKVTPERMKLVFVCYVFLLSRIFDLLDTVFFVLRKRNRQITFLHTYHHAGIVAGAWFFNKFLSASHGTFLGILNSYVHVVMYGYYFLTSFKPELKESLWWKKHITQLQLIQFVILMIHFTIPIFNSDCTHPKGLLVIGALQNLFMFILFGDFYFRAYLKQKPQSTDT